MKALIVEQLVNKGTFFKDWEHLEKINFIKSNCSDSFGENIVVYHFDFEFYTIYFNYDFSKGTIESEQVEFFHNIIENQDVNFIQLVDFLSIYKSEIESVYSDEDEDVVFMKNGVDVYFSEIDDARVIQKITSRSDISREFVRKTLTLRVGWN